MKINHYKSFLFTLLFTFGLIFATNAQTIAAGGWHSLTVCNDSTVKAFGENASGQLGDASNTDQSIPVQAIGLTSIIGVSAGGDQLEAHSLALKNDGTVWSWGSNIYGALGNGTTTNTNIPGQVLILTNVKAISAGGWHSSALKNDGTVWTWGWNTDGQLGDGTFVDRILPAQVNGLSDIIEIAAGTYHMLALKSDGTVWAWGDNISGQIGDGSTTDRTTPVQVSGLTNVVHISAGRFFSLAVKSDGSVWTWGENLYGQLGNGNTTNSSIPVQVPGLTIALPAVVATGAFHCLVVKTDGTVWSWGRNSYGNLGDGSVENRYTPVQMLDITNVTVMAAGTNFSLLAKSDGTFWGCGRNASGQLGDGTVLQRNTVVQSTAICPILQPLGISSANNDELLDVSIFPNPSASGLFNILISEDAPKLITEAQIEVFNSIGVKIFQSDINQKLLRLTINLSNQPSGLYFMTLTSGDRRLCRKLIKQ